jgi:hypothetical protein
MPAFFGQETGDPAMKRMLVVVVAFALSGCGTVCNLAGGWSHPDSEPRIYGGVQKDIEWYGQTKDSQAVPTLAPRDGRFALVVVGIIAMEPALTFLADTLTLPLTIYLQERRVAADKSEHAGDELGKAANLLNETPSLGNPVPVDEADARNDECRSPNDESMTKHE